jgi:hypothetical protein
MVGGTYTVTATGGGSGNPVTYSVDHTSSSCTLRDATVAFTGAGTCVIDANQAGNAKYAAGVMANQSFPVRVLPIRITSVRTLPSSTVGQPYSFTFGADGGDGTPAVWALVSGALSDGLHLNPNAGGIPNGGTVLSTGAGLNLVLSARGVGRRPSLSDRWVHSRFLPSDAAFGPRRRV